MGRVYGSVLYLIRDITEKLCEIQFCRRNCLTQLFCVADSAKFQALCSLSESMLCGKKTRALSQLNSQKQKKTEKGQKQLITAKCCYSCLVHLKISTFNYFISDQYLN